MTPSLSAVASAMKTRVKAKRGGSKPFETEIRMRVARLEFLVIILCLRVFGVIPGLGS